MAYGTVNADVIGTSVAGSNIGAGNASIMKNRIINGAMVIDQRNAGASVTPSTLYNTYVLDRWNAIYTTGSKFSVQQVASSAVGFPYCQKITSAGAYSVPSGELYTISQNIEGYNIADLGWGTANAKTVTLSFWVQSSLTGTFGGALLNSDTSRSYPFSYTISAANTWEYKTVTVAGDTSGTWLTTNGIGMQVRFGLGVGSTYSGTAGSWSGSTYYSATGATNVLGTSGATWILTGVQLEVGSSATGFEYRQFTTELQLCQRYYETTFPLGTAPANGVANGYRTTSAVIDTSQCYSNSTLYTVRKRTTPTVTTYNTDNCSAAGQAGYFKAGVWNNGGGINTFGSMTLLGYNFTGSFTLLGAYYTDLHWTASAEL